MRIPILVACIFGGLAVSQPLLAQDAGTSSDMVLDAEGDGFPIHITYFPAKPEAVSGGLENAPVVILLHGEQESRLLWNKGSAVRGGNPFPVALQLAGYAVVSVDLRKHGESVIEGEKMDVRPDDYGKMVLGDMRAVKEFLKKEHQKQNLNMRKTGIVASGMSAPVALAFAEFDWRQRPYDDAPLPAQRTPRGQDIQTIILLSPEKNVGRVQSTKPISFLRNPLFNIAFQVVVGAEDTKGFKDAKTMYDSFASFKDNKDRCEFVTPPLKDQGIALLQRPPVAAFLPMLKFLDTHLKTRDFEWRDRRSALER